MKKFPIIFIHKGGDSYLACSLTQAKASSPESEVHLIGDRHNTGFAGVNHWELDAYSERAQAFGKIYQHRSTNSYNFELVCLQRWFVLGEFLRKQALDSCLYLDSDVLLFARAEEEARRFADYALTLSGTNPSSPHCMYLIGRRNLDAFCDFVVEAYTNSTLFRCLEAVYIDRQARGLKGGVCDMTAFDLFRRHQCAKTLDISVVVDGVAYDNSMCDPTQGFEMRKGIKLVRWKENLPCGRLVTTGQWVRLMALHFQGPAKGRIFNHVRLCSWKGRIHYWWNRLVAKKGKYQQKLERRLAGRLQGASRQGVTGPALPHSPP